MLSKRISSMLLGGAAAAGLVSAAQASLTLDLRAVAATGQASVVNAKLVNVSGNSGTVTFEIHGVVAPATDDGNALNDGTNTLTGSFVTTGSSAHGNLVATRAPLFTNVAPSSDGTVQDLDNDGDADVGGSNTGTVNYFGPRSSTGQFVPGADSIIGTLVLTLNGAFGAGDTLTHFTPRPAIASAGWSENGVGVSTNASNLFLSGPDVVLHSVLIPEPASIGLIGLAGLGMLARRRK